LNVVRDTATARGTVSGIITFNKVYVDGFPIFISSSNNNIFPQQLLEHGFLSLAIIPLTSNNEVLGSLNVLSKKI
jgi:GAF domain-containing protein